MHQHTISSYLISSKQVDNDLECTPEGLIRFEMTKTKAWNKAYNELFENVESGDMLQKKKDILEEHFPKWFIVTTFFGSKGTVLQHIVIECVRKYFANLGHEVDLIETKASNGKFDATLKGNKCTLDKLCEEANITHKKEWYINVEVKCIQVNSNEKKQKGSKGSTVDIQRLKPDNFEVLILGTHFRDCMNVYIGNSDDLECTSNGKSADRGKRQRISTNISLKNEQEALESIESQILQSMTKVFVIDLK